MVNMSVPKHDQVNINSVFYTLTIYCMLLGTTKLCSLVADWYSYSSVSAHIFQVSPENNICFDNKMRKKHYTSI